MERCTALLKIKKFIHRSDTFVADVIRKPKDIHLIESEIWHGSISLLPKNTFIGTIIIWDGSMPYEKQYKIMQWWYEK